MSARVMRRAALLVCALPAGLLGQQRVGTSPVASPFRDLEKRQEVTLLLGTSAGGKDPVNAAPNGGSAIGVRYDVNLGNSPLTFTSSLVRLGATRQVIQPGLPLANRNGGTVGQGVYFFDMGLDLLLTGNRAWHGFQPGVSFAAGIAYTGSGITDSSNFDLGTRFKPSIGFGLKYAPERSRWTVRADITNHFYSVPYPQTFRDTVAGVPRVVGVNTKSSWVRNTFFTLGVVRGFGRR